MRELLNKRTLHAKHFDIGDGKFKAEVYAAPVHFKKNGKLVDVKEFKLTKASGEIKNSSDVFDVKVKGLTTKVKKGSFEILGLYLDDTLLEAPKVTEPTFTDNQIIYKDIFDGVDVVYDVTPYSLTENIIIKKNPLKGKNITGQKFGVRFKKKGLEGEGEAFAFDARGRNLPVDENKAIDASMLYISTYPITIDPIFSLASSAGTQRDVGTGGYVKTNSPSTWDIGTQVYEVSRGVTSQRYQRVYLKFNLTSLAGMTITSANCLLYMNSGNSTGYLRQVATPLDPTTATALNVYNACIGTLITSFTASLGQKTLNVQTYVDANKGGTCDFGVSGVEGLVATNAQLSVTATNPARLDIEYTEGGGGTNTDITANNLTFNFLADNGEVTETTQTNISGDNLTFALSINNATVLQTTHEQVTANNLTFATSADNANLILNGVISGSSLTFSTEIEGATTSTEIALSGNGLTFATQIDEAGIGVTYSLGADNLTFATTIDEAEIVKTAPTFIYDEGDREWVDLGGIIEPEGEIRMPVWNIAGRPQSPSRGRYGFNMETGVLEIYDGLEWKSFTPIIPS
jgi:hypothetical protein